MKTLADGTGNLQTDVALTGAGMIAQRHVSALSAACRVARLVTIVSRHPDRTRHLSQYYEGPPPKFVSDLSCVVHDPAEQVVQMCECAGVKLGVLFQHRMRTLRS